MERLFLIHSLAIVSALGSFCSFEIGADLKQHPNLSLFHQAVPENEQSTALPPPPDNPKPPRRPRGDEGTTRKLKTISNVLPVHVAQVT